MKLRDYQLDTKSKILDAWTRTKNVLSVLPTGAGKTVIFSSILAESPGLSVAIAHRREILGQISLALAVNGVRHSIIGPTEAAKAFARQHREDTGRSWIDPNASVVVASVDTLAARTTTLEDWGFQCRLWVQDEAHHVLIDNKWGKVTRLFPNARGLGVTATPLRSDGRSLKHGQGGLFDELVQGPGMRALINQGFLTDYRIFAPPSDMKISSVPITRSGEYNQIKLAHAAHESHIVGDVVGHYKKLAPGEKGVTFVTDVKTSELLANEFRAQGVPAAALNAKSKFKERFDALRAFKNGDLMQLVNVDLFGEGFDLPAIGVVSFARPTASYGLYCQQFGRDLRPCPGKTHGKIIDHVGNVMRHGLPDRDITWSLDGNDLKADQEKDTPLRTCEECLQLWEGYKKSCPYCGHTPKVSVRSKPSLVEGDLLELDPAVLRQMRGEVSRIDSSASEITAPLVNAGASESAIRGLASQHRKRQQAQETLRGIMSLWGGHAKASGLTDSARYIKFYREFGIDVLSAQAIGRPDAEKLTECIKRSL